VAALGVQHAGVPGNHPGLRPLGGPLATDRADPQARREQLRAASRVLESCVPLARRLGVAIGVETHDDFSASAVVAELLAMADPDSVGAVWDSHHPHRTGETPAEVYANLGGRILLTQIKDARRAPDDARRAPDDARRAPDDARRGPDDDWRFVLLGQGEVPVRQILALLAARGYRRWISVEWEKHWHPEIERPEIALPQYLTMLAEWTEVAG
jgi:sugar phosphate isomerase/epimerase